ncbi:MAG: dihydrodipicolinate synthase family protein, partial [Phycisphaerae bacterium]|nr:dihydrodipicolinate synthase family protein [Phycisphaerae bacterium]
RLFDLATRVASGAASAAERDELRRLYAWFLPLLRLDVVPEFVHLIKLAQEVAGMGSSRVRLPRLPLGGEALARARGVIESALAARRGSAG